MVPLLLKITSSHLLVFSRPLKDWCFIVRNCRSWQSNFHRLKNSSYLYQTKLLLQYLLPQKKILRSGKKVATAYLQTNSLAIGFDKTDLYFDRRKSVGQREIQNCCIVTSLTSDFLSEALASNRSDSIWHAPDDSYELTLQTPSCSPRGSVRCI